MPSMSYCRFENTLENLNLCHIGLQERVHRRSDFSESERKALQELVDVCRDIADEFSIEVFSS